MAFNTDYILIAGLPRSGSTLLQLILNNNPQVFTLPETHFYDCQNSLDNGQVLTFQHAEELLLLIKEKSKLEFDQKNILDTFDRDIEVDELFFQLIEYYRPKHDQKTQQLIGLEKTPGHLFYIDQLLQNRESLKVILTIRGARDFCNSIMKTYWAPSSLQETIDLWNRSMREAKMLCDKYPDQVILLPYEEIVQNPLELFPNIFRMLDLHWSEEMIRHVNRDAESIVVPHEIEWKRNNILQDKIVNKKAIIELSWRQRGLIFIKTFFTALYCGYSREHRL